MKTLTEFATDAWPMMADFGLQATVLLGAVVLAYYMCKRLSSARKHALLLAGLLGIPILLLVSGITPALWRLPGTQIRQSDIPVTTTLEITPIAVETESIISTAAPQVAEVQNAVSASVSSITNPEARWPWQLLAVSIWLIGVAICMLRLAIGWLSLRSATTRVQSSNTPRIVAAFDQIKQRHPALPLTRLLESNSSTMPMTFGILRPAIVMPHDAGDWPLDRIQRVLLHELAHVARRDCLTNTLALISCCLLWFHPLTWINWRLVRREQESAADDWALQHTADPEAYADDLVAIVRAYPNHLGGGGLALSIAMARGNAVLKKRLDSLLDNRRDRSSCGKRLILVSLPFCLIAVTALGGLVACQDKGVTALSQNIDSQETRLFPLSDVQQNRLLVRPNEYDPFADPATSSDVALQDSLQRIKDQIASLNITPPITNISLPSQGALVVTGATSSLGKIEDWLKTVDGTQDVKVGIAIRMFKVPSDLDVETLLNMGDKTAGSNVTAGTLPDAAGQALFKSLRTHNELELIQIPALSTRAGQITKFERIRELIYPTEFDPDVPQFEVPGKSEKITEIRRLETLLNLSGDRLIEEADDLGVNNATLRTLFPQFLAKKASLAGVEANSDSAPGEIAAIKAELAELNHSLEKGVVAAKSAMATQIEILKNSIKLSDSNNEPNIAHPALPTAFEVRNVGTTFEFLPRVLPDGRIDLELDLEQVRFLGFVDYGTPIRAGEDAEQPNKIQQPLFETSKCTSSTTLKNHSWVIVAGFGAKGAIDSSALNGADAPRFERAEELDDSQFVILIRVSVE